MTSARLKVFGMFLLFCAAAQADTLYFKNGKTLQGTVVGSTARQVDFLTESGNVEHIPVTEIDKITYSTPRTTFAADAAAPDSASKPSVMIPAGTALRVRTIDPIDVDVAKAGAKFRASLDDPIIIGGSVVVPKGAEATLVASKVQQSGNMKGSDLIELKLESVVVKGSPIPLVTSFQQVAGGSEGSSTAKKIVGGAGLGAILGGVMGGGSGAAVGAAAGAGAGAVISTKGEQHLKVPAETRLEFKLESAVKI
jgi:hypothetical protein